MAMGYTDGLSYWLSEHVNKRKKTIEICSVIASLRLSDDKLELMFICLSAELKRSPKFQ